MKNFPIFNIDLSSYKTKHITNISTCQLLYFCPNLHIVSEVIHWYRAKKRKSFAKALSKSFVKGSGRKPFPQKGKGMARQGSLKNPHQRGGGVAFPPTGRSFEYKINKKKMKLALQSIFFTRLLEGRVIILDEIYLDQPSSHKVDKIIKLFNLKKILFIDSYNHNLKLSIRNLKYAKFILSNNINTLDFTYYPNIILSKKAFQAILFSLFS